LGIGDWGLGTGDWGLGTGDWGVEEVVGFGLFPPSPYLLCTPVPSPNKYIPVTAKNLVKNPENVSSFGKLGILEIGKTRDSLAAMSSPRMK